MSLPQSRRLDFSEIPVIDVADLMRAGDREETVHALGRACRDVGFLYVTGHGVSDAVLETLQAEAHSYFALPSAEKETLLMDERLRGYLPLDYASYTGEPGAAKSRQEGFWTGYDRPLNPANKLDGPNRWPATSPGLKPAMLAYRAAVERLAKALQVGFSLAMGWPEDRLTALFEPPQSLLKLNHYPPQENPTTLAHIGVVPHSDSGGFTILWQDAHGGLEVQSKSSEWVGAPPIPGTLVVNIGAVLQIWTDGAFSATPHRVINRGQVDRYSIPFIVNPAADAPIAPLSDTAGAEPYWRYQRASWRRTFPIAKVSED